MAAFAFMLFAQAVSAAAPAEAAQPAYGPAVPVTKAAAPTPMKTSEPTCSPAKPDPNTQEIVICAERPQGYRLNPDVMKAKREYRGAGRPVRRGPVAMKDTSCAVVGPAPCMGAGAGINLIAAAATLATMADRLAKGQEIGSMFITDPHPSEYQLYLEAKYEREANENEQAMKAIAAKAQATAAAKSVKAAAQTEAR